MNQFPALFVGFKVEIFILVDEAVAGQSQVGLDAGLGHGLGSGARIVVQVRNRGNAEAQALGNGQQGSGLGAAGVHLGFLLQKSLQGLRIAQVVGVAAQHGGCQLSVAVNQARNGYHAGAVDDGFGGFFRGRFGNGDNFAILDANIGTEEYFHFGIHGHGSDVGNQGIQIRCFLS